MTFSMNRIFSFVALAGLLGAATSQAGMQAKFHLPVTVHWGHALLTPGDYKISMISAGVGVNQFIISNDKAKFYAIPLMADAWEPTASSSLRLVEMNGDYFVKEYRSDVAGKTYSFSVPKDKSAGVAKTLEIKN